MSMRRRDALLPSVANGVQVWLWYASVEYLVSTAAPMLHPEKVLNVAQWRGTVFLFACYAVWGILMGLLAWVSMDAREVPVEEFHRRNRKLLILLMTAAFGINLVFLPYQPGKVAALLAMLLVGLAVIFNFGKAGSGLGLAGSPAAVAGLLIVTGRLAFISWKSLPELMIAALTLLATLALLLAAFFAVRLAYRVRSGRFWSPTLEHCLIAVTVFAMIFGPAAVSASHAQISAASSHPGGGKPMPNIILITMDTVRADHLGIYGYARQNTPNLQELLKESTLYTRFTAASPITLTSHASMFTGLYPRSHGAFKQFPGFPLGRPLADGIPTITSILDSAGYRSMALSANLWFLGPEWGMMHGFEYAWTPKPIPLIEPNHPYLLKRVIGEALHNEPVANDLFASSAVDADTINRRATRLLDQLGGQQAPFFLFLNYMDAHWPYQPPAPFNSMYPGRSARFSTDEDEDAILRNKVDCDGGPVPAGYPAHATSQYDGAIAYLDFKIGELVHYLKRNGLFDNALIIITSDHGEALGDRGSLGHNVSVYQDQIHVPLIVKYPGRRAAGRVDDLASHVDFLPTILDVTGLAPRTDLPGVSLLKLSSRPDRTILSERHYGPCQITGPRVPDVEYAVLRGSSKMISSSLGVRESYDLAKDPGEQTNLYATAPPLELESYLHDWMRNTTRLRQSQQPLDPEQLKRLRSLGYLQ